MVARGTKMLNTWTSDNGNEGAKTVNDTLIAVKDALYISGHDMKEIFRSCSPNEFGKLQRERFIAALLHEYGVPIQERDLYRVFNYLARG
jgi:hypothetical protein